MSNETFQRPHPQQELQRVLRLKAPVRRKATELSVWCETGKCCVVRVYRVRGGQLLEQVRGALLGSDDEGAIRTGRSAIWIDELDAEDLNVPMSY